MLNFQMSNKCHDFCDKEYVKKVLKSLKKNKKMSNKQKIQFEKGKKLIPLLCKINYCNKGCVGIDKKYNNDICNSKKCKKTYKKIKIYPIDTFCSYDYICHKK
jgi:hypothetical protein